MARVCVVGLGYVGTVAAACLADAGHAVTALDVQQDKIDTLNAGESPIVEPGLHELLVRNVRAGRLRASSNVEDAASMADVIVICVGTPTASDGQANLDFVQSACESVAPYLGEPRKQVILTSTVPSGTSRLRAVPWLESQGGKWNETFDFAFVPEFLREGCAVADYQHPERLVIGLPDDDAPVEGVESLFAPYPSRAGVLRTTLEAAELTKITDNCWHALKVAFSNEVGRICSSQNIDAHEVMRIFAADSKLNISNAYLTPGFAYGGSCLPKDLRAMRTLASSAGVQVPILDAIASSNDHQVLEAISLIEKIGARKVALLGITFKAETDDLRESPLVKLANLLSERGILWKVHDSYVRLDSLIGQNRNAALAQGQLLERRLTSSLDEALEDADLAVVGQPNPLYSSVASAYTEIPIVDLCGIAKPQTPRDDRYFGLSW